MGWGMQKAMRVHHVVGLVRPENLEPTVARMSELFGARFYPVVQRSEFGIQMAISLEAGIELIAPLAMVAEHPLAQALEAGGERWMSVVMATDDLDAACARLERLGAAPAPRLALMDMAQPYEDRVARFDQMSVDPAVVGGLQIVAAEVDYRA